MLEATWETSVKSFYLKMKQAALFVDTSMQEAKWQRERTEQPQLSGPRTVYSTRKVTNMP